jgi:hypothetical protein
MAAYAKFCNCTTKSIVYPYYFNTISILWKYTIIMDNQNLFYFQWRSIQFPLPSPKFFQPTACSIFLRTLHLLNVNGAHFCLKIRLYRILCSFLIRFWGQTRGYDWRIERYRCKICFRIKHFLHSKYQHQSKDWMSLFFDYWILWSELS